MREILFRGQTRKFGEKVKLNGSPVPGQWVYGGVWQGCGDHSIIYGEDFEKYAVYTDTVSQYVGKTDKNGMKIFEGDIVKFLYYKKENIFWTGEIEYAYGSMFVIRGMLNEETDFEVQLSRCDSENIEVIGNVFDNPEFLQIL